MSGLVCQMIYMPFLISTSQKSEVGAETEGKESKMTDRTLASDTGSFIDSIISRNRKVRGLRLWYPESEVCGSHLVNEAILPGVVFGAIEKNE